VGARKISLIVANNRNGDWDWIFTDPHFKGELYIAYSGPLEQLQGLKAEYEAPATDIPF